jgi:exodeoxyribonuclease V gamma subunit
VLRDAFERDPTLTPEDVIVMAPRIDEIAPDIEAVFDVPHGEGHSIPHRIADRGVFQRSPVAEAFRGLLDLLGGRAARSEVLEWLAREPARARFGLDEEAVERLASWGERAGVRFGLDEDHRADLGLARTRAHTWADGLERLALAHAVGASGEVFADTAPIPLDPFAEPAVLGAIGEVETMLSAAHEFIALPRPVAQWCGWLADLLEESCDRRDSNAHEHTSIRGMLQDISESAVDAGFEERIPFEAIRERVGDGLESSPAPQAFLAGGVTFCELVPLRAIPFRVVAILGMSDDAFPRGRPAPGFDLMARSPRAGDRSTRNDDRYLFLEALLSVRDRLILTVPGQDVRDGSDLPPSIVVTELLDAIEGSFRLESVGEGTASPSLRGALVIQHPLQSFSPRYFESRGDSRLLGRDEDAFLGAKARREALQQGGGESRRFLAGLRSAEESQADGEKNGAIVSESSLPHRAIPEISLNELIERVLRATRYFTRERLGIRLPRVDDVVGDLDPFELPPLEQFSLGSALLDDLEAGATIDEATRRLMSRASIPAGVPGSLAVRKLQQEVAEVARIGRGRCVGDRLADVEGEVSLDVAGLGQCRLTGRLDRLWSESRVQVGIGRVGRRAELDLWIRHLFLCALESGGDRPSRSVLVGRPENAKSIDHVVDFEPVADARVHLARLFDWAWSTNSAPLPFFPKSSRAFAEKAADGKLDQAWRAAHQAYHGGDATQFVMPESEEELEYALLWEGVSPLDNAPDIPTRFRFDALASEFFAPLLAARKVHAE